MSSTELYGFDEKGDCAISGYVKNAFRGAMAIWAILERKYLPSLKKPIWADLVEERDYWSRTYSTGDSHLNLMKQIWDLFNDERLTKKEKIVLGTTFDTVLVKGEDIDELIDAFKTFEGETSLKEQAAVLEEFKSKGVTAIGFNQTSVCSNQWHIYSDDENEEGRPYNYNKDSNHFWLFDEFKTEVKNENI